MTRLIDEEEAFKVLSAYYKHSTPVQDSALHDALSRVPTAVPVRRHGKWIHRGCGIFACSKCGKDVGLNAYAGEKASETFKWCPHCGARMDEE